jgi:hypothetical protein
MLRVVNHPAVVLPKKGDALFDHPQVFLEARSQHLRDVHVPRLAEDRAHRRLRYEQGLKLLVVLRAKLRPARRTERRNRDVLPRNVLRAFKELDVLWIRSGPPAFDESDSQRIQVLRDPQLVVARQTHPFHLRAVTQSGVVDLYDWARAVMSVVAHSW